MMNENLPVAVSQEKSASRFQI